MGHVFMPSSRTLTRWVTRHPRGVIVMLTAVTLAFSWLLPGLSFRTAVYDLVIEDLPETAAFHTYQKIFGADDLIRIVATTKNVFDPATFRHLAALSEKAGRVSGVRRVISLPDIKKAIDVAGERSLEDFAGLIAPVSLFDKNLISADHRRTIFTLALTTGANRNQVIRELEEILEAAPAGVSLYQIGMPIVSRALARWTQRDFLRIPPVTLLIITLLLWLLFKNYQCLLLPLAGVVMTLIWTFGLMTATGVPLSMLTMIVPVFLIAVGTAYCLHLCSDYLNTARQAATPAEAAMDTLSNMALPTTLAVLTTLVGIGSLMANKMTAIREFAMSACFAMSCLLIITMTLFPALMAMMPLPDRNRGDSRPDDGIISRILAAIVRIDLKYQRVTLPVIALVVVGCVVGISRIRVETTPLQYFRENTEVRRHFHDIYQDLSGSFPVNVVLEGPAEDYFESPAQVARIERLQTVMDTLPGVDKTVSFADYLKLVNFAVNRYDPAFYALPEEGFELRMLINQFKSLLGGDMLRQFMSPTFSTANILLLTHISNSRDFLRLREQITDALAQPDYLGIRGEITGFSMVVSTSSHVLATGQIKSLGISLVLIFGIMLLLFLSSKVGAIAIIPNCFPIIVNFGLMGWLGIPLSIATTLIGGIAIGLAVDDTIHYLVCYNREFKKDLDKDRALRDTVNHVGPPILFSTLVISVGFSVLIFSSFQPTALFGILMVVTMVSALVGDLILLPSLMRHVELVTAWDLLRMIPTLGGMSAGMVHELNQPLNAIKMGSDFLKIITQRGTPVPVDELSQVADEISRQVDRASDMIHRLGAFDEKPGFTMDEIDINQPVRETVAIIGHQLALDNIIINLDLADDPPRILGRKSRLNQVVYNLMTNAGEAMMAKRKQEPGTDPLHLSVQTRAGKKQVVLRVSDPGIGIPGHLIDRVTEPFFTTKETGGGKGLGLAITQEIVRAHDGRMTIDSTLGEGTTVRIAFPALESRGKKVDSSTSLK